MLYRKSVSLFALGCFALALTGCFKAAQDTAIYQVSGSENCAAKTTCQVTVTNSPSSQKSVAWNVAALSLPGAVANPMSGIVAPGETTTVTVTAKTPLCDSTITFAYHEAGSNITNDTEPPLKLACDASGTPAP